MIKHAEPDMKIMLNKANDEIRLLREELQKYRRHNARGAGRKSRITEEDKKKIVEMRREGISYNKIAAALQLPVGSIFNYSKLILNDTPVVLREESEKTDRPFDINEYIVPCQDDNDFISRIINRDIMSSLRTGQNRT